MSAVVAHSSDITAVMSHVLLFFGVAGLVVPLLQRLHLSPVLGYLVSGIVIGPSGLSRLSGDFPWIKFFSIADTSFVNVFGEFGIIALMFMIGLELSLRRLKELRVFVFGVGSVQIFLSGLTIMIIARLFHHSMAASLLIGASLALSSTAVVMQLLDEKRLINQNIGILCFSILLMQDLAVVPILVLAGSMGLNDGNETLLLLLKSLGIAAATVAFIYVLGRWLLRPVLNAVAQQRNPEWLSAFTLLVVIGCASITILAGLSAALGAFLAGLLIAETEIRYEVELIIAPLKSLFLGLFFMSIGMMIDPLEVLKNPGLLFAWVASLFIIKAITIFLACHLFKVAKTKAIKAAIFLAQPGEFAFIVINVALLAKVIAINEAQFFFLVTALSMLLTPLFFEFAPLIARYFSKEIEPPNLERMAKDIVIIAGFGRIGQILGSILEEQRVPYVAIDYDAEKVRTLQAKGFPVVYGDAKKINLWDLIHAESAIAAVITVDEQHAARNILKALQMKWPLLPIIIRANDLKDVDRMHDLGAKYVVPETLESSLRMARLLMHELGMAQDSIDNAIEQSWTRNSSYSTHF